MTNKMDDMMAQAVIEFARNGLKILSEKYGGDCTLNEARVMVQIIHCHLDGRTCSVTGLHKATGIPIPTVSRAVANLQREGWLSERQDPSDGRKRIISFGPRSEESTPDDIGRSVQWIKDFRKNGLPG
ncbi:MAG: MarR family transcriptional regulator [Gammaproteobacteria bacterium]|jgi:DNA-binding MarR family transcriptional regulator|nr:MarR family transcriptional regulator [Gammaproteobacteria bacterium]